MKTSVDLSCFLKKFGEFEHSFSQNGLKALFEFLVNEEKKTGVEIKLDVSSLCHQYTELEYTEIAEDYEIELSGFVANDIKSVRNYLEEHTIVVADLGDSFIFAVER